MDIIFAALAFYLLAFSFASAQLDKGDLNATVTPPTTGLNLTHTSTIITPSNSTTHVTVISNLTDNTTPFSSTTRGNETTTKTTSTTTEGTSHLQTTPSTSIATTRINLTSLTTASPGTNTPTFTALTTASAQTTGDVTSPDTTVKTTASSSHTVNTTSDSMFRTKQGLGLNSSEVNMTIVFSVVLGVFAVVLVLFMFQRCKHRIQYLPQPLTNTDDADGFVTDEDTLVISGGLYDGHPIYDNVPTAPEEQSQFRLEFLH